MVDMLYTPVRYLQQVNAQKKRLREIWLEPATRGAGFELLVNSPD